MRLSGTGSPFFHGCMKCKQETGIRRGTRGIHFCGSELSCGGKTRMPALFVRVTDESKFIMYVNSLRFEWCQRLLLLTPNISQVLYRSHLAWKMPSSYQLPSITTPITHLHWKLLVPPPLHYASHPLRSQTGAGPTDATDRVAAPTGLGTRSL